MSGEAASRARPDLPGASRAREGGARPRQARGRDLSSGRPLMVPWLFERADAVLATWFLGSEAGNAVGDVLAAAQPRAAGCRSPGPSTSARSRSSMPSGRPAGQPARPSTTAPSTSTSPSIRCSRSVTGCPTRALPIAICARPAELRPVEGDRGRGRGDERGRRCGRGDGVPVRARSGGERRPAAARAQGRGQDRARPRRARHRPLRAVDRRSAHFSAPILPLASSPAPSRSTSARARPQTVLLKTTVRLVPDGTTVNARPSSQPDWSAFAPLAEFGPIERTAAGFRARTEAGPIEVSAVAPDILRLTLGEPSGPDFGILVAKPQPPTGIAVDETEDGVGLKAGDLHLLLRRRPLRLTPCASRQGGSCCNRPPTAPSARG